MLSDILQQLLAGYVESSGSSQLIVTWFGSVGPRWAGRFLQGVVALALFEVGLRPLSFTARTQKVYSTPLASPVTVWEVVVALLPEMTDTE